MEPLCDGFHLRQDLVLMVWLGRGCLQTVGGCGYAQHDSKTAGRGAWSGSGRQHLEVDGEQPGEHVITVPSYVLPAMQ